MSPVSSDPDVTTRLEQLVLAGVALTGEASLEGVLHRVANIAADVIGARYAAIGVLAPDGRTLESFTTRGIDDETREQIGPLPRGHGILGLVIREAKPIRLPDLTRHPSSHGFPPHHPPMHTFLGVPIASRRGGVFGNLYLTEKDGGAEFSDNDERIAVLLASMAAAAVENARLHEESARLLEEVHLLHRNRERFFAMVNHELRNALAAVHGWAEMMVRKKDPATVPRAAFEVLDSAQQAVGLINDLLDLSRLDEDRLRPVIRLVDPASIARRAVNRVTPAAEAKGAAVEATLIDAPGVSTDANRVEQILVNLLGNAIKHTPDGGTVELALAITDHGVSFRIADQGPGVADDDRERVFDIYVSESASTGEGIGLGLPLSRRLARMLGGELRVTDRSDGGDGACFVLDLPLERTS